MSEFKIGDKVYPLPHTAYRDRPKSGTIVAIPLRNTYTVRFDNWTDGHTGSPDYFESEINDLWNFIKDELYPKDISDSPLFEAMREDDD